MTDWLNWQMSFDLIAEPLGGGMDEVAREMKRLIKENERLRGAFQNYYDRTSSYINDVLSVEAPLIRENWNTVRDLAKKALAAVGGVSYAAGE